MISHECIAGYQEMSLSRGDRFLYIPPHDLLRPYISNYTISFPTPQTMPDEYTILPSASSTMTISVSDTGVISRLRGVNTKACQVGAHANKMKLLLLIEFHPGGIYPFIQIDQHDLVDSTFMMGDLDKTLIHTLENAFEKSDCIVTLVEALDRIFISRLMERNAELDISAILYSIIRQHGNISAQELSSAFYYSDKQIRRLFLRYVGIGPKMFSRIVRVNHALRLLQNQQQRIADIAVQAGFFDQSHLIHDFHTICSLTPQAYIQNMSVFYNDRFKM